MKSVHTRPRRLSKTLIVVLALALLAVACQPAGIPVTGSEEEVAVQVTESGVTTPQTVPSGIVTFNTNNTNASYTSFTLARLNTDVTLEQFMNTFQQDDMEAVSLVTLAGGRDMPVGETTQYTTEMKEGIYVFLSFADSDAPPLVTSFTVSAGDTSSASAPEADVSVDLVDFAFALPVQVSAGEQVWEVSNTGAQWHHMIIVRPNEGVTEEDLVEMFQSDQEPQDPPPFEQVAAFDVISPGERGWATYNLEPGSYLAICFLPDFADGQSHFEKGMIQSFDVQ